MKGHGLREHFARQIANNFALPLFALVEVKVFIDRIIPWHLGDKEADAVYRILGRQIVDELANADFFVFPKPALILKNVAYPRRRRQALFPATLQSDLNPIEQVFVKLKHLLRKAKERTVEATWKSIGALIQCFSPQECANYLALQPSQAVGHDVSADRAGGIRIVMRASQAA